MKGADIAIIYRHVVSDAGHGAITHHPCPGVCRRSVIRLYSSECPQIEEIAAIGKYYQDTHPQSGSDGLAGRHRSRSGAIAVILNTMFCHTLRCAFAASAVLRANGKHGTVFITTVKRHELPASTRASMRWCYNRFHHRCDPYRGH